MAKSAEIELKIPKRTLEKWLERRPIGARAAGQLFIMMCSISPDGFMADVYCVEEHASSMCEHGWQEMHNYRHVGKNTYIFAYMSDMLADC
jgi:hypothetical protein